MAKLGSPALVGVLGLALLAGCSGQAATGSGAQRSAACIPASLRLFGPRPSPPTARSAPLNAAIVARFAIFRRDAPAGNDKLSRELSRDYTLASWYPGSVRRLGRRFDVVAAYGRREAIPAAGCASAGVRQELAAQQQHRLTEPVYCVVEAGRDGTTPLGCEPFAAVGEDVEIFRSGVGSGEPIVELVPDGVASVRISYRARSPIVVPVSDNALVFAPPPPSPRVTADQKRLGSLKTAQRLRTAKAVAEYDAAVAASDPTKLEWIDRTGGLMRTIDPPTAEAIAATSVGDLRAPIGG